MTVLVIFLVLALLAIVATARSVSHDGLRPVPVDPRLWRRLADRPTPPLNRR